MHGRRYFGGRYFGARYFGDGSAPADGSYAGARYFGRRYFAPRYFSPEAASGGSEWDLAAPMDTPLAGVVTIAGDLVYTTAQPFEFEPSTMALAATLAISGEFVFGLDFGVAQTDPIALSGTVGVVGEFEFSDAPLRAQQGKPRRRRTAATPAPRRQNLDMPGLSQILADADQAAEMREVAEMLTALFEAGVFNG